jgi:hypothetical protein
MGENSCTYGNADFELHRFVMCADEAKKLRIRAKYTFESTKFNILII